MKKDFKKDGRRGFRRDDANSSSNSGFGSRSQSKRHSFNPNFDENNQFIGGERTPRPSRSFRRDSDDAAAGRSTRTPRFAAEPTEREKRFDRDSFSSSRNRRSDKQRDSFDSKPRFSQNSHNNNDRRSFKNRTTSRRNDEYPRYEAKIKGDVRLNRFVANSGICSRREADELIQAGVISVNGVIVTELGTKVRPTDVVRFNDSVIKGEKNVYILMNKPKGYVTTIEDPHADKTVMDLVKDACTERIYPVGRLDKNSMGVLLFTNDGELTKKLTHPSYNKSKIYQVSLDKPLTAADMQRLADGIVLEDGEIAADEISYIGESKKEVGLEIHSGRNRIVRRMFDSLGYNVTKLDRVYFAGLTKKKLKRGAWRFLTPQEVAMLKSGLYK